MLEKLRFLGFRAENFKRIKLVEIRPTGPVTNLVGPNGAGKSSGIDSIWWALGGAAGAVKNPVRRGEKKAKVEVDLDELTVMRTATAEGGETLVVKDREGTKQSSGQTLLNSFLGKFFDPVEFVNMKPAEQTAMLAKIAGIDLRGYIDRRKAAYDARAVANRFARDAAGRVDAIPLEDAPAALESVTDLVKQLTEAQTFNAGLADTARDVAATAERLAKTRAGVEQRLAALKKLREDYEAAEAKLNDEISRWNEHAGNIQIELDGKRAAETATPRDLAPIQTRIAESEKTNAAVRRMMDRKERQAALKAANKTAEEAAEALEQIDAEHEATVKAAKLPIDGLGLTEAGVVYNGTAFEECSQAEQLRVAVAIGLAARPGLRLLTIKQGSLIDPAGQALIHKLATEADAVVFMERVDMGNGETGVYISDGEVVEGGAP